MRPRYDIRVASIWDRQQGHRPWVLVRLPNGTDGARVVASYDDRRDAIAEAERREDMQEGLRRIGVAVAVWAGMAAARAEARRDVVARHALALALDISVWHALAIGDDLAAERAARRKWELRLRARADRRKHSRKFYYGYDRLQWRASRADSGQGPKDWRTVWWISRCIAGPRGVLP